jgi:two-component system, sporulation sensor kinase D
MMNIYAKKQRWKRVLFVVALLIIFGSVWYTTNLVERIAKDERSKVSLWAKAVQKKAKLIKFTNELFTKIKDEERKKAELMAEATSQLSKAEDSGFGFTLKVLQDNTTVPVILTDANDRVTAIRNLDSLNSDSVRSFKNLPARDSAYLRRELAIMKQTYAPVVIEVYKGSRNFLYYKDSRVFSDIKLVFDSLTKSFLEEVAVNTTDVPVIITDSSKTKIIAVGDKIDTAKINTAEKLQLMLTDMAEENPPLPVDFGEGQTSYIFYAQSELLTKLKYYPYVQFGIIGLFLLIAYILFSTARKAEQDQVWVGMSKETAHQLGTPLSSLMAWNDHLKNMGVDESIVHEMGRDIERLNTITERFSKIGSQPTLQDEDICAVIQYATDYLKQRTSKNVKYDIQLPGHPVHVLVSVPLFEWVIENLCKNAVDAMNGKGQITVKVKEIPEGIAIDVSDTGKGIPKSKFKTVFEPGYTTKKRGWGLGLSLCKRIVENYHKGKILVLNSEPNKGTTFRILLHHVG